MEHVWYLESSWCGVNGYQPLQFTPSVELHCSSQCHAESVYTPSPQNLLHQTIQSKWKRQGISNEFQTLTHAWNQTGQIGTKEARRLRQIMRTLKWWDEAATFLLGKVMAVKNSKKNTATTSVNISRNVLGQLHSTSKVRESIGITIRTCRTGR